MEKTTTRDSILVVDDNPAITKLFTFYLKSAEPPVTVLLAENGKEAIRICQEKSPSVVLMDVQMPVMDGITAIKKLRTWGFTKPIVVVSAWAVQNMDRCLEVGADSVIKKPVGKQDFLRYLANVYPSGTGPPPPPAELDPAGNSAVVI